MILILVIYTILNLSQWYCHFTMYMSYFVDDNVQEWCVSGHCVWRCVWRNLFSLCVPLQKFQG